MASKNSSKSFKGFLNFAPPRPSSSRTSAEASAQGVPLRSGRGGYVQKHTGYRAKFQTLRRWTKIFVALSHCISALLSIVMEAITAYVSYKYYKTKDLSTVERPEGPWARDTKLWPTYLLAAASAVTVILSLGLLIALCCRNKKKTTAFSILYAITHIVFWIAISVLYRVGKTGDDLWGWSCSEQAEQLEKTFDNVLDFSALCKIQTNSWYVSIGEVAFKIVSSGVSWYFNGKQHALGQQMIREMGPSGFDAIDY